MARYGMEGCGLRRYSALWYATIWKGTAWCVMVLYACIVNAIIVFKCIYINSMLVQMYTIARM